MVATENTIPQNRMRWRVRELAQGFHFFPEPFLYFRCSRWHTLLLLIPPGDSKPTTADCSAVNQNARMRLDHRCELHWFVCDACACNGVGRPCACVVCPFTSVQCLFLSSCRPPLQAAFAHLQLHLASVSVTPAAAILRSRFEADVWIASHL
jgi:hypothetical protein